MQFPTILLLLSAGALHTTLALPTNLTNVFSNEVPLNETSSELEKRSSYGWIASYQANDWNCKGKQIGLRPKVHDCIPFAPLSDNVGISWGSWPLDFDGLDIFTDTKCKVYAGKTIKRPDYYDEVGPGSCLSVKKHGAHWGSVMRHF
ncbi:MAG: hypothetical protein Q9195_003991 [Heterodermia aff. obscurata]